MWIYLACGMLAANAWLKSALAQTAKNTGIAGIYGERANAKAGNAGQSMAQNTLKQATNTYTLKTQPKPQWKSAKAETKASNPLSFFF